MHVIIAHLYDSWKKIDMIAEPDTRLIIWYLLENHNSLIDSLFNLQNTQILKKITSIYQASDLSYLGFSFSNESNATVFLRGF